MISLEDKAREFAILWHGEQKRKYTGEPYWHHCRDVANLVRIVSKDEELLAAAWLHDTLEDTPATLQVLESVFGMAVSSLVEAVTDMFTPTAYPDVNRASRKKMEALRLGGVSVEAKTLKLADMISNTSTIQKFDPGFARVYLQEKKFLLPHLKGGDEGLFKMAMGTVG